MKMTTKAQSLIVLIFFFATLSLSAQVNLVPNPSFEEHISCPNMSSQLYKATPWVNPTGASPDYFNSCATTSGWDVPSNAAGNQEAIEGNAYVGIFGFSLFNSNLREYIQIALSDSLIKGIPYKISFFVSLGDDERYSVNTLGAYLSKEQISRNDYLRFEYIPQIINNSNNPLTNKEMWMLVTDTFISNDGGEKYITIGNFNDDADSDTLYHFSGDTSAIYAYYFIDNVSVISLDTTTAIPETEKPKLKIFPNPASNQITIEQLGVSGNQLSVEVYDALGRLVFASPLTPLQGERGTNRAVIDVSGFSKGVYLLRVKEKEEVVFWEKLIIE